MRIKFINTLLVIIISLLSLYCSPAAIGMKPGKIIYSLGKARNISLYRTLPLYLMKYQFQIKETYSYGKYSSMETEWKTRYPKEDEIEKGVREGRIRIIL